MLFYMLRVQGACIAKKQVKESRVTDVGQRKYDSTIIHEKGDIYMVDCNVTGSDAGTSDKPKFLLKHFFETELFPQIVELVCEGCLHEGYIAIIQCDNAGPHNDKEFVDFCGSFCEARGWLWCPQAPQMPHMNNLDLAVFPCMSKHHRDFLRGHHGNSVADPDEVWKAAKQVWDDLPSATIACGYVLAYHIAEKVVQNKGSNTFLQGHDGSLHSGIRANFYATQNGVKKKNIVVE